MKSFCSILCSWHNMINDNPITRLTKERDLARTELEVCKHDLDKLEADLKQITEDNKRLRTEQSSMTNGMEKGSKEILEAKENEIKKLTDRVKTLESEVEALKKEKEALEKKKEEINTNNVDEAQAKKVAELNEQIKVYKAELADKQKEFQHEKAELQKVIEEQKEQILKGGSSDEALNKELTKARQEVKEAAVERERFQSQLEMLVTELEQKQVSFKDYSWFNFVECCSMNL